MENIKIDKSKFLTITYAAFIAGMCSIVYELLIATTASYFMGDSVKYFSITIGLYIAAMGLGSMASQYTEDHLILKRFIIAELYLSIFGGLSIPVMYMVYAYTSILVPVYIAFTVIIGFIIGLEIPFLTRLMQNDFALNFNIAHIMSFDCLGALFATISFPFIMLPFFGIYKSSLIFGMINLSISMILIIVFTKQNDKDAKKIKIITIIFGIILVTMMIISSWLLHMWDNKLYKDRIVYTDQTPYQKIVITKNKNDLRLFLDGNLQFSSIDEYRYHESLVHVPMSLRSIPVRNVLLLGAGDGLAAREILKYPEVENITLVDLDQQIINISTDNPYISSLNRGSLLSDKVEILISDAWSFLHENDKKFDLIIIDLPDPNNHSLSRMYSKQFYKLVHASLARHGAFVTQSTSPYFSTKAFWSIVSTISEAGLKNIYPYHAQIPSFGDWGFVLASSDKKDISSPSINIKTRFLDKIIFGNLFVFEKDIQDQKNEVEINTLDDPVILRYYLDGWKEYGH